MDKINKGSFFIIALIASVLAFSVIVTGAYTRLTDSGLGCPDWPACYGQLTAPKTSQKVQQAQLAFPGQTVEPSKARIEMFHRYMAGALGILVFILAYLALRRRVVGRGQQRVSLSLLLVLLVLFQAALGMWTVTLKLWPTVVMGHLLGGMAILSLLWWYTLRGIGFAPLPITQMKQYKPWVAIGLLIVVVQIALGGWTSANYAGLVCLDFPFCQGQIIPALNFSDAFNIFQPLGLNYDGGELSNATRVTIQVMHRFGALITMAYVGALSLYLLFFSHQRLLRNISATILVVLVTQIALGILTATQLLILPIAVAHNAIAALMLVSLVTLNFVIYQKSKQEDF